MNIEKDKSVNKIKIAVGYLSHMLINLIMFTGVAYFVNEIILDKEWNNNYFIYAAALFGIIALYCLVDCKQLYSSFKSEIIMVFCFLVSALLLLVSDFYINVPIWLIGGIAVAALVNRNIGMMYIYFFVFHAIYLQGECINGLVFHFVCATILCLLIPKMKTWSSMLFMMIFTGALVIIMTIVINQFILDKLILLDAFSIMCTYFICIIFTMFFVSMVNPKYEVTEIFPQEMVASGAQAGYEYLELMAQDTAEEPVAKEEMLTEEKDVLSGREEYTGVYAGFSTYPAYTGQPDLAGVTVREDFSAYCNEKSELLQRLKAEKKSVYAHAILTGKLAYQAAERVDLNATLAKAVALFEAVVKLNPDESAQDVLAALDLPESLVHAVVSVLDSELCIKETALVSMADDIISNYTIIRHMKKMTLAPEKIVDKTLEKKMYAGEYDASGLSVSEYSGLRNAFVAFLAEQDKRL